ncbi:MAG: DUF4133 domain-containing protein [Prevotellaceae bacterium]|nr:DUF4133 domain-containing protein [Prevotellaceae bacterium]
MAEIRDNLNTSDPEYHVYRGLQKPLEAFGLRGRYIYWAAAAVGCALLSLLIGYIAFGFLISLCLALTFLAVGAGFIFYKQHKGLHTKKVPKGVFIFYKSRDF